MNEERPASEGTTAWRRGDRERWDWGGFALRVPFFWQLLALAALLVGTVTGFAVQVANRAMHGSLAGDPDPAIAATLWTGGAVIFLGAAWLAIFIARAVQRPLRALVHGTKSLAEGRLDARVEVPPHGVFGLLAGSFNDMAAALQESRVKDEARVKEIQRMIETVRESKNFFYSLVNSLPLYVFRKDAAGRYTFVNDLACARLGRSLEDILGQTDADLAGSALAATWREDEAAVIRDEKIVESDETFTDVEGRTLHFHVIRSPVFNEAGAMVGVQGIVLETTARRRAEQELAVAQARLVETSRFAGMAEVATGVLHNVGNVLNSVNLSAGLVVERLRKSKVASLARAVELMRGQRENLAEFLAADPKGRQLPGFITAVSEELVREQAALTREAQALQKNVEHIKQIVAMQQSYSKVSGALEKVALADLMEDAVRMSATAIGRHRIELVREFAVVPAVLADRHIVLQILVNLVTNAKQALDARAEGRRLVLRIARSEGDLVRVEVADNGLGIALENLAKIFGHGFTTKKTGHGFGLHSSANAAKEMGGSLTVRSDGPGTGATFVLELPLTARAIHSNLNPRESRTRAIAAAA